MKKNRILNLAFFTLAFLISACNPKTKFTALTEEPTPVLDLDEETRLEFKIEPSTQTIEQIELNKNFSYLAFQIRKSDGTYLADINANDLKIYENNSPLTQFKLTKNSYEYTQVVDIVFTVDVTGSMSSTIEAAKERLRNFVYKSRESGYHTRMCLVTFGDFTIKKCDRFYDNNPKDPTTWSEVQELLSEIAKLKAITGSQDPGGSDFNENPMRALIDASKAPWAPQHQRFAILVTDDGFLFSPGNSGAVGDLAPRYSEVLQALENSKMKVFAATPSLAGYNKKFGSDPGVIEKSGGEWFKFSDLIAGRITLDNILNRILVNVNTTFVAEYVVEEQIGIDPSLPINKRKIKIELKDGSIGEVVNIVLKSNLPDGRQEYPKDFKLVDKDVKLDTVIVWLNDIETKNFTIKNKRIVSFNEAPPAKTKIKFSYEIEDPKESIRVEPVRLPIRTHIDKIEVRLNGVLAQKSDFKITNVDNKYYSLTLEDQIFSEIDTYKIRKLRKLELKIRIKALNN